MRRQYFGYPHSLIVIIALFLSACGAKETFLAESILVEDGMQDAAASPMQNPYDSLSVPTCITKVDDTYFIVDCYHDRVLYHDNLTDPVSEFSVLPDFNEALSLAAQEGEAVQGAASADGMKQPHTIASDGVVYLVDDTENNRVLVYERVADPSTGSGTAVSFQLTQYFDNIGVRPHYTVYDEETKTFYIWSSFSGELYLFQRRDAGNRVLLTRVLQCQELAGVYVRSFTIEGDDILFVSGLPVPDEVYEDAKTPPQSPSVTAPPRGEAMGESGELLPIEERAVGVILRCDKKTLAVKERYPVPDALAGMVQILAVPEDAAADSARASTSSTGSETASASASDGAVPEPVEGSARYFITVSTDLNGSADAATMIQCRALSDLAEGDYEEIYDRCFLGGGTPYYMGTFDGHYFLTEHRLPGHSIWKFHIGTDGEVTQVQAVH